MSTKPFLVDHGSASTYDAEHNEMCCPSCGSWTDVDHIEPDPETGVGRCPACRDAA